MSSRRNRTEALANKPHNWRKNPSPLAGLASEGSFVAGRAAARARLPIPPPGVVTVIDEITRAARFSRLVYTVALALSAWRGWALRGAEEDENGYRLELLGLQRALESRHDAAPPLGDGFDDRGPVRAEEIQFFVGQIGRSERWVAGGFFGVTVEAVP